MLAVLLAGAAGTAGCSGGNSNASGRPVSASHEDAGGLDPYVARASDLPGGYKVQSSTTERGSACLKPETREQKAAFERLGELGVESCVSVTFRKEVGSARNQPSSGAFRFSTPAQASQGLGVLRTLVTASAGPTRGAGGGVRDLPVSGLGEEAAPGTEVFDLYDLSLYLWRTRNVVAFLGSTNALGDMPPQTTLDIAKKIDFRSTR